MADLKVGYTEIAQKVFEKYGEKKPMHYKEIAEKAADEGWLTDAAGQAEALREAVESDIAQCGRESFFIAHGREYLGLHKWMWHGFAAQIHDHNSLVHEMLRKKLLAMDAEAFARCVVRLLEEMGFEQCEWQIQKEAIVFANCRMVVEEIIEFPVLVWAVTGDDEIDIQKFRGDIPAGGHGLLILRTENKTKNLFAPHPNTKVLDQETLIAKLIDKEIWEL